MKFLAIILCQFIYLCSGDTFDYTTPLVFYPGLYGEQAFQPIRQAEVQMLSADGKNVVGRLNLYDNGIVTTIVGTIRGLTPGYHGFHAHENGELGNNCLDAGGIFNPDNKKHGSPYDEERKAGDLGNIDAGIDGTAKVSIVDHLTRLSVEKYNVTGKSFVVHADPDDLGRGGHNDSLVRGHVGVRVACGIIRPLI